MITDEEIAELARKRLVSVRHDQRDKSDIDFSGPRQIELARIIRHYNSRSQVQAPASVSTAPEVFISCSFEYQVGKELRKVIDVAKEICMSNFGLSATTGGDKDNQDPNDNLSGDAISRIQKCAFFVAVMTPDSQTELVAENNKPRYWPSPWIPFEIGMALALSKPVGLLVSRDIDEGYVDRILGGRQVTFFSERTRDFEEQLFEAINRVFIAWMDATVKMDAKFD